MLIKVCKKSRDVCCEQLILLSQIFHESVDPVNKTDLLVDTVIPSQLTAWIERLSVKNNLNLISFYTKLFGLYGLFHRNLL